MKELFTLIKRKSVFFTFFICFFILIFSISKTNYKIGAAFFGDTLSVYNVSLAQFFFERSAYPVFGKPVEFAHYQLSRTYFIQGRLDDSLSEIEKELALYPENVRTYYILGLTYGYMNQEQKAIDAFSVFIESNPTSWAARNDKAWLQFRVGDIDGALATILPVSHDTKNPWVQNTYGTLLMNKDRISEAEQAFLFAQKEVSTMTDESWGRAYPGNDPRIYATGLSAMRNSIEKNLALLKDK